MHTGLLRGLDHLLRIRLAKARNVVGDAAAEQFDVLRQIADVRAEVVAVPAMNIRAVQAHGAAQRRPDAHQHPGQGRFAGARGAEHAQHFAGAQAETDLVQGRRTLPRRTGADLLELTWPLGAGNAMASSLGGKACSKSSRRR